MAEGEDVAANGDEIVEDAFDFMLFFAEAEHHSSFGGEALVFGDLKELEAAVIFGLGADRFVKARDGFDIMI